MIKSVLSRKLPKYRSNDDASSARMARGGSVMKSNYDKLAHVINVKEHDYPNMHHSI